MLTYNRRLKAKSRSLRSNSTDAELHLGYRLRRKQIRGVQFYRRKTIGNYIADFYAPAVKLVIESTALSIWNADKQTTTPKGSEIWRSED